MSGQQEGRQRARLAGKVSLMTVAASDGRGYARVILALRSWTFSTGGRGDRTGVTTTHRGIYA